LGAICRPTASSEPIFLALATSIIEWNSRFRRISILAFIMFIVHESFTMTENKTNIDKVAKLLDILDKHMQEENCKHSPNDLFEEYEFVDSLKNN